MVGMQTKVLYLEEVHESLVSEVPQRLQEAIERFVWHGVPTGGFLFAALSNDLMGAIGRADAESLKSIGAICKYIGNAVPMTCYGSPENVRAHIRNCRKFYDAEKERVNDDD